MVYTLRFFLSSKCSLFHNSNVFGSCIIHILYTGVLKLKKNNNTGAKMLTYEEAEHTRVFFILHVRYNVFQNSSLDQILLTHLQKLTFSLWRKFILLSSWLWHRALFLVPTFRMYILPPSSWIFVDMETWNQIGLYVTSVGNQHMLTSLHVLVINTFKKLLHYFIFRLF